MTSSCSNERDEEMKDVDNTYKGSWLVVAAVW